MSVSAWPGPSLKYPYFFEEVTYWFERNFCLSTCLLHGLTSGQEESRRERKERRLFHPYATLFLTLKTRCVSIREPINKSWMELETVLVNENFNELQTALAPLLADCDDVLSQSRLKPSSFLLSSWNSLLFLCHSLHSRANERSQWSRCKTQVCCVVLSHNWTSDYMDIHVFNGTRGT